jgi:hypothetical protein
MTTYDDPFCYENLAKKWNAYTFLRFDVSCEFVVFSTQYQK